MAARSTHNQRVVHSVLSLLTCMFRIVAMLNLLDCREGACNLSGRRDAAQPHIRAAAVAMPAICWQAHFQ